MWRMSGRYYGDYKPMVFKLKAKKCNLFQSRARYLERIVTADGYTMDPADEAAVPALKEAKTRIYKQNTHIHKVELITLYFNFDSPLQKRFLRAISRKRLTIEVSALHDFMFLSIHAPLVS